MSTVVVVLDPKGDSSELGQHGHLVMRRQIRAICTALIAVGWLLTCVTQTAAQDPVLQEALAALEAGDYPKTLSMLKPLAEQGNAEAQFYLGRMYAEGRGITKDDVDAMRCDGIARQPTKASRRLSSTSESCTTPVRITRRRCLGCERLPNKATQGPSTTWG